MFGIRAQCHAAMSLIRDEPDFKNPSSIVATYRCAECGLLERARIQSCSFFLPDMHRRSVLRFALPLRVLYSEGRVTENKLAPAVVGASFGIETTRFVLNRTLGRSIDLE